MSRYVAPFSQTRSASQHFYPQNSNQTPQLSYLVQPAMLTVPGNQLSQSAIITPQLLTTSAVSVQQSIYKQPVLGQSRLEYIPYQRKVIDYEQQVSTTIVPKERLVQDYYTVEHQLNYIPQTVQEPYIEYVPVQKFKEKTEYSAVQSSRTVVQPNYNVQYGNVSTVYTGAQYLGGYAPNVLYASGINGTTQGFMYSK